MVKLFSTFIVWLLLMHALVSPSAAQEYTITFKPDNYYTAYILKPGQDTIYGKIRYKSMIRNQIRVIFKASWDAEDETFEPEELEGYGIHDMIYRSMDFSGRDSFRRRSFMQVLISGPVSMYKWIYHEKQQYFEDNDFYDYSTSFDLDDPDNQVQYFLQRTGEHPVDISMGKFTWKFNKAMSKYLSDDPELAKKIRKKSPGYTRENLREIIAEYNKDALRLRSGLNEK